VNPCPADQTRINISLGWMTYQPSRFVDHQQVIAFMDHFEQFLHSTEYRRADSGWEACACNGSQWNVPGLNAEFPLGFGKCLKSEVEIRPRMRGRDLRADPGLSMGHHWIR